MLTAIRQWVIKTMLKSKGQTGVVQTLPKKELIEINTQITAQRLLQNGIDPNALRTSDQVENAVIAIETKEKANLAENIRGGIGSTKSAKVFDLQGKEIKNTKNIMGGEELPPPGSRGGPDDIAAPFASREETMTNMVKDELMKTDNPFSDLVKTTEKGPKTIKEREAEVLAGMEKNNKEAVQRIRNRKMVEDAIDNASPGFAGDIKYDAELVAEDLAERMGKVYDDLPTKERIKIYDEAYQGLSKQRFQQKQIQRESLEDFVDDAGGVDPDDPRGIDDFIPDDDPEPLAQGGRAGFKAGSGKGIMEFFKNMMKPKKPKGFDERRFREGPIDLNFLGEIKPRDLEKFIRSRDMGGRGGYGIYKDFKDMPAGLRAAELISTIKGPANKLNYRAAELFLGKKLRGDETVDELLQVLNRQEMRADGGRIGYKDGPDMGRRTFLKILGGLAAVPIIGKFIKPIKTVKGVAKVPIIQTAPVKGKPEWFDALVNKVIIEGDDVTKKFATKEREIVHSKDLGDGTTVRVTQDIDDGAVRVEYESEQNVFGDNVQLEYKKPLPDEGNPNPAAEFTTAESGPVSRQSGPDDFDIDVDEVGGSSISDLDSDVSKLKEYATGKKPTIKEILQSKKRKDKARAITEDPEAQSDAVIARQGDYVDYDDYASGGIARMLGE